ncbi:olfactory receptor 2K2-like [Poecilia reticulata]|uniref:olfactory receptor 2K2-like n=1 Tax=Poecilia reticulata TaxID=8081 RepID=UPI0004A4451F|nr:PREDICTED: olfactory receptor 2K2-like [Poecilia reticulata]
MENLTFTPLRQPIVFELEGFDVPPGHGPLLFFLALFAYMVVLLGNGVVICVVMTDRNLHRPMFVMICHLVVCDLLGATAVLPSLMMHFLTGQRKISYLSAIIQGFCVHTYGVAMHTILGVMAIDRYVAVCEPLRYHSIMTSARLHSCCAVAWIFALVLIAVLFSFHVNLPYCSRIIQHVYCSNKSIMNLACTPPLISNIYGLFITWFVSTGMFVVIAYSYIRILRASFKQGRTVSSIRTKAFQTCASHFVVYVFYELATMIIIVNYRFPSTSQNINKFLGILFVIISPAINPIIYGLVSKDLRSSIIKRFSTRTNFQTSQGVEGIRFGGLRIPSLLFADDVILLASSGRDLQLSLERYVAVCEPLRYHSIMTSARLHSCCAVAWIVALLLIAVLFSFHMNVPLCGRFLQHVYCSNRIMMSVACIPTPMSDIYGLSMTWSLSTGMFIIIAFSYIRILAAVLKHGRTDSSIRTKAFQTCASHLVVYVFYEIATLIIVVSYRFPSITKNITKFLSILFIIVPPAINPIIYGLVSRDLRSSIIKRFSTRTAHKNRLSVTQ